MSSGLTRLPKPDFLNAMKPTPLSPDEIKAALADLPGWSWQDEHLVKTFLFGGFREAMSFMMRVAFEAEALHHHPDWSNVYNRVSIRLATHDVGTHVTEADVELARRIQRFSWVG